MADANSTHTKPEDSVYFRDTARINGDFSDARVILVAPGADRASPNILRDPTHCFAAQNFDGPTFITIGPNTTDSSLAKASERYGVSLADLLEFRANHA